MTHYNEFENTILPTFATPKDFIRAVSPLVEGKKYWFIFSGNQLLVGNDKASLPSHHEFNLERILYLGTLKDTLCFAGEVNIGTPAPTGFIWIPLRQLYTLFNEAEYSIAGYAMQLLHWDHQNKFCGSCGAHTIASEQERCRKCTSCGALAYPKASLAILALIKRGNQILLARNLKFTELFYSVLAGFVDPGETLEQCVRREILEEVGIKVKNVQYFGSQPWPFSHSFMIGFTCEWQEGEIQIDPAEIIEAAWFDVSNLPLLPSTFSLSRLLIDEFVKTCNL